MEELESEVSGVLCDRKMNGKITDQNQIKENHKHWGGSFRVKSPKITENLNPTDSDFNEIWYTCYLGTHSTKSKICIFGIFSYHPGTPLTCHMSKQCLDDMKRCQICLYSALYCRFPFANLYCG